MKLAAVSRSWSSFVPRKVVGTLLSRRRCESMLVVIRSAKARARLRSFAEQKATIESPSGKRSQPRSESRHVLSARRLFVCEFVASIALTLLTSALLVADEVDLSVLIDPPIEFEPSDMSAPDINVDLDDLESTSLRAQIEAVEQIRSGLRIEQLAPPGTAARLANLLSQSETHRRLRRAVVSALIDLDAAQFDIAIWEAANADLVILPTVELALTDWRSTAAVETWRARLRDPTAMPGGVLRAINGLANCGDQSDADSVESWLIRDVNDPLTLAAARALAALRPRGNLSLSARFQDAAKERSQPILRLVSATLIRNDPGDEARERLLSLAASDDGNCGGEVIAALRRNHPAAARNLAPDWIEQSTSIVRQHCVESLADPVDAESLPLLSQALDDGSPAIRALARRELTAAAADPMLKQAVIDSLMSRLQGGTWREIEQAILGLTELEQREIVPELMELLDHPRGDVQVTAAWGLRRLASDPATIERVAERLVAWANSPVFTERDRLPTVHQSHQMAHLIELLGIQQHQPIQPTLETFIPRGRNLPPVLRATAIWALGKIRAGTKDPQLTRTFVGRMQDMTSMNPEHPLVGYAAIIGLGFLGNPAPLEEIRPFAGRSYSLPAVGGAAAWAVAKLEGAGDQAR